MRFLLIDEILELSPGRSVRAVKTLSADEELFRDHFPGFPVVPGVLLTEMMAQAAGKCLYSEDPQRGRPMLARIDSAAFRGWVKPEQRIVLTANVRSSRPQFARVECQALVDGHQVAAAELFFGFVPNDRFTPDYQDVVLERFVRGKNQA